MSAFLDGKEWYDNHRISMILNCPRKAFYHLYGPQQIIGGEPAGLSHGVGDGANFGTAMHAGLATYYGLWGIENEPRRRLYAIARFKEVWDEMFGARLNDSSSIRTPHRLARGPVVLNDYFSRYEHEDSAYKPLDPELSFAVEIDPARYYRPGTTLVDQKTYDRKPFWFVGRTDGIFQRQYDGDKVVNEYKTTAGGVDRRLKSLKRSRQGRGYVACMRMIPGGENITGFMGVVILVAADKVECGRDYFPISPQMADSWVQQTITIVVEWRDKLRRVEQGEDPLSVFVENDEECFSYGQCAFYNLCQYGINAEELAEIPVDHWNPLDYTKSSPKHTIAVDSTGDKLEGIELWTSKHKLP